MSWVVVLDDISSMTMNECVVYLTMVVTNLDLYCNCVDETVVWHFRLYLSSTWHYRSELVFWTGQTGLGQLFNPRAGSGQQTGRLQEAVPPWTQIGSLVFLCVPCETLWRITWCVQARLLARSGCRQRTVNTIQNI